MAVAKGEWFGTEAVLTAVAEAEVADAEEARTRWQWPPSKTSTGRFPKRSPSTPNAEPSPGVWSRPQMLTAATSLDADLTVDPEVVAVLAAGPACSRAAS